MPYTWDDYYRERKQNLLKELTPAERLKGLSIDDILKGLNELLQGLPVEERFKGLSKEEIEALKRLLSSN